MATQGLGYVEVCKITDQLMSEGCPHFGVVVHIHVVRERHLQILSR